MRFSQGLKIEAGSELFLEPSRIQLLELIEASQSIAEAARQLGISYRTAWRQVKQLNELAKQPLLTTLKGGKAGGHSQLTPYGQQLVANYRAMESEYRHAVELLAQRFPLMAKNFNPARKLQTSARNQLACYIRKAEPQQQGRLLTLDISPTQQLTTSITEESYQRMNLQIGRLVLALIKATAVQLASDDAENQAETQAATQAATNILAVSFQAAQQNEQHFKLAGGQDLYTQLATPKAGWQAQATYYVAIQPQQILLAIL